MFSTLLSLIGLSVSVGYPLLETCKLVNIYTQQSNTSLTPTAILNSTINVATGLDISNKQLTARRNELTYKWLIYWVVFAILLKLQSFSIVGSLISILPFSSFIILYFQIWLVFPIVQLGNPNQPRVNGSYVIYHVYISPYVAMLDNYLKNVNFKQLVRSLFSYYNARAKANNFLPQIPINLLFATSAAELERETAQVPSMTDITTSFWSRFTLGYFNPSSLPSEPPSYDESTSRFAQYNAQRPPQEVPSDLVNNLMNYAPNTLIKSLASPIIAVVHGDFKVIDGEYTVIGSEDFMDELNVNKIRAAPSEYATSYDSRPQSRQSSMSKSSWGFRRSSRNPSTSE